MKGSEMIKTTLRPTCWGTYGEDLSQASSFIVEEGCEMVRKKKIGKD